MVLCYAQRQRLALSTFSHLHQEAAGRLSGYAFLLLDPVYMS